MRQIADRTYTVCQPQRVAFLGLGVMGYPMAGHLATAGGARRLSLDPGLDELGPAPLVDVAQFRRKVSALAKQGVATDAVIDFPHLLACGDRRREIGPVVPLGKRLQRIEGQREEQERKEYGAPEEDVSRHGFGECPAHGTSLDGFAARRSLGRMFVCGRG